MFKKEVQDNVFKKLGLKSLILGIKPNDFKLNLENNLSYIMSDVDNVRHTLYLTFDNKNTFGCIKLYLKKRKGYSEDILIEKKLNIWTDFRLYKFLKKVRNIRINNQLSQEEIDLINKMPTSIKRESAIKSLDI